MFENGILATFIPEILMVIGFVLCLFTPGFQSNKSTNDQTPIVAQVSTYNYQSTTNNQQSTYKFELETEAVSEAKYSLPRFIENAITITFESHFSTSEGISFIDFSRPPPHFFSL